MTASPQARSRKSAPRRIGRNVLSATVSRLEPRSPSRRVRADTTLEFDFTTLEHRLRELAFLNGGVTLVLTDLRGVEPKSVTFHYEGGLEAFVTYLDRTKQVLHAPAIAIRGERDGMFVEIAME